MSDDHRICVGAIAGAFGVKGELRLKSFTASPEDIADYAPLTTEDGNRSFDLTLTGQTNNALTARFPGIATKEQADALRGVRLYVPRDRLPSLPDDEFYHADLIGLDVVDTGGVRYEDVINVTGIELETYNAPRVRVKGGRSDQHRRLAAL